MIKFSEYVLKRDEELNEAGWGRALNSAISGIGRVPIQALRGGWNAGMGGAQALAGAGQTAAGIGKGFLGGGWDTAGRGLGNMAQGTGRAVSGLGQAALSPLSGLGRAYYANRPGGGGFLGMAPNTNNPGAWGSFKNWMGWQGKPQQPAVAPASTPEPQQQPAPTQQGPKAVQGQMPPQMPLGGFANRVNPQQAAQPGSPQVIQGQMPPRMGQAPAPTSQPNMTQQQRAFFQNNPGFNAGGMANQPIKQQIVTPQSATATQTWTPPEGWGSPPASTLQPTATTQYLDDHEARFNAPRYQSWLNNEPGSSPAASSNQQSSNPNMPSPSNWEIDSQFKPVMAGSGFQMQPSNPSMPAQSAPAQQSQQSQIPPAVGGTLANLPSLFQLKHRGGWDGQRQLMPHEASQGLRDVKKAMQGNNDPQHQQQLQNTYNYLLKIANPWL